MKKRFWMFFPVLVFNSVVSAQSPGVKITALDPVGSCIIYNGRLLKNLQPMRAKVRVRNLTDREQSGVLRGQVVGNLDSVYGLADQHLTLKPGEDKLVWEYWSYSPAISFEGGSEPSKIAKPTWGHEIEVAWVDSNGKMMDRRRNVFAIDQDGLPERGFKQGDQQMAVSAPALDAKAAFALRYCGYLRNPAFGKEQAVGELKLSIDGKSVGQMAKGMAPSGYLTYVVRLEPSGQTRSATLEFAANDVRLGQAWLLSPQGNPPEAQRCYHRVAGKTFTFDVPAARSQGVLILETRPWRFVPPIPVEKLAAAADKKFGPARAMLRDADGQPITSAVAWEKNRGKIREKIWKGLLVRPEPAGTPLDPRVISEEWVCPQMWPEKGCTTSYLRRKVSIQVRLGERMNVWVLVPPGIGPFPAMLVLHQTINEGKDEAVGLSGYYHRLNFGPFLAARGYVVVAPDSITVGERYDVDKAGAWYTTEFVEKDPKWSLIGRRVVDHMRTVDYVQTLPMVDKGRIGAIGHSLGGESVAYLMAMDDRVAVGVQSCGMFIIQRMTHPDGLDQIFTLKNMCLLPQASFRTELKKPVGQRNLPFDGDDLAALWAPRPFFWNGVDTEQYEMLPEVCCQTVVELQKVYKFLGAGDRLTSCYIRSTHDFNPFVQPNAFDWLDYWMKKK